MATRGFESTSQIDAGPAIGIAIRVGAAHANTVGAVDLNPQRQDKKTARKMGDATTMTDAARPFANAG